MKTSVALSLIFTLVSLIFSHTGAHASEFITKAGCSTSIKCGNGSASCNVNPRDLPRDDKHVTIGTCGAVVGKYRQCAASVARVSFDKDGNEVKSRNSEYFSAVCCDARGNAMSFDSKVDAQTQCATPGTVE